MAEAFVADAASNAVGTLIVEYLVKPVDRRLRYLFRFNKIVEELRVQGKNLTNEETRVKEDVQEAKLQPQTQVIEKSVEDWLTDVENALKDVQSLECRIQENKRCFHWCPNWSWRYQLSKMLEQKTLAIRKLVESSKFDRVGHRAPLPGIELFKSKGYLPSKSSTSAFNEIMEALMGDEVNMIGVWGMAGVGKTTLVTEVGNKAKSLQLFQKVIKVVVSQTPIIENIQKKIADFLDLKLKKTTQEGKAEELWLRLKNEEKVLIILDDMWKELSLKEIGIPLGENQKGCTIILTTRRRQVCNDMESQVTVSLDVLDKDEAWTLFKMKASLDNASPDIIDVANEVAKECGGLPIAIVTLAWALRSKDLYGWKLARDKLKSSRLMAIEDIPEEVEKNAYLCLKMSYDHLRSEMTRRCLLLCALYPEDYSIDVEDLVRYAWGLRLYQNAGSIQEVRMEVFEAINNLKDSCLLLEDHQESNKREDSYLFLEDDQERSRYIKVHDVVRDVAMWIASKEDIGLVTQPGVGLENESSKQKLQILLFDNFDSKTSIDCFEGMPELKVLSLRRASKSNVGFFSLSALKSLKNLRALQLEGFKQLRGISALAKLTKLEILSVHSSEVPESVVKLGELKNLRVFDIRWCRFLLRFPPNLIRRLVNVEELFLYLSTTKRMMYELYELGSKSISTSILPELNFLPRLASLLLKVPFLHCPEDFVFPKLERYRIAINRDGETNRTVVSSRILTISRVPLNVISELLWNVEFLEVSNITEKDIKYLTDTTPVNVAVATILKNLKGVKIGNWKNLQVLFQMKKEENHLLLLSKLENLFLWEMPNLEYIWKIPIQHISLRSLEVVRMYRCRKLKCVFSFSLSQSLVRLQVLEIIDCGELEQIVEELEGDEHEISPNMNPDKSLCFPKLRTLEIDECDSLEYIFPNSMAPQGLPQLQKLRMTRLSQLKQICRPAKQREENGILLHLPSLTDIRLRDCPELTEATVHLEPVRAYLEDIQLSKLKEALFIKAKNLTLKRIRDHNLIPEVDQEGINELTFLELDDCGSLEYLVDTTMLCNGPFPKCFLQNLEKLEVRECGQLKEILKIVEGFYTREENQPQLLSNLEHLELESLPELRWIWKASAHYFNLQSLKVVKISRCEKLMSLFSPSLIQSLLQLEELKIEHCDKLKTLFGELGSDGETESNPLCLPTLRTLFISDCGRLEYLLPITLAQGLPQLEELQIKHCDKLKTLFGELESDGETESNPLCLPTLRNLFISDCERLEYLLPITLAQGLPQLENLKIEGCDELKQVFGVAKENGVVHCIKLPRLKDLTCYHVNSLSSFCPENYFVKAPALEKLTVSGGNNRVLLEKNLIPNVDLKGLTSLELRNCKDLECLVDTTEEHVPTGGMFTNLVELVLENVFGLKMLCNGQPPKGFLQNLETLKVERCMDIVSLSLVTQNLKKLTVKRCEKLQEVFRIDELHYNREENQAPLLSNLDCLELKFLPELRWVLKGSTQYVSLRCLKVVLIHECNELESLFSSSLIRSLRLLEELDISSCDKLETVFAELESDDETESNTLCLPNLKTLKIRKCPRLKYVLPLASTLDLPRLEMLHFYDLSNFDPERYFIKAPALDYLTVTDCPGLSNFTIQQEKPLQSKLRILRISGCEKLDQIIVNDDMSASSSQGHDENETSVKYEKEMLMFPELEDLCLEGLPSLTSFCPVGYHLVFPSLDSLKIKDCSKMITSFTMDSTLSVHAKTKAPLLDDTSPSNRDINWRSGVDNYLPLVAECTSLPPYVEEADEISELK